MHAAKRWHARCTGRQISFQRCRTVRTASDTLRNGVCCAARLGEALVRPARVPPLLESHGTSAWNRLGPLHWASTAARRHHQRLQRSHHSPRHHQPHLGHRHERRRALRAPSFSLFKKKADFPQVGEAAPRLDLCRTSRAPLLESRWTSA